jgi:hypothetical protein
MRAIITALSILTGILLLGACTDDGRSQPGLIGGCAADTFPLHVSADISCEGPASPVRISILSVERLEDGDYDAAAAGLIAVLDSLGARICGLPRLVVITEGPCWPRCRIDIRMEKGAERFFPEVRSRLESGTLAGSHPSEERPADYGLFFVQAGVGSTDLWTLWYDRPRR